MGIKILAALATVVLSVTLYFARGEGKSTTTTTCLADFSVYCSDLKSASGLGCCCTHLISLYRTDPSCMCTLLLPSANTPLETSSTIITLLERCSSQKMTILSCRSILGSKSHLPSRRRALRAAPSSLHLHTDLSLHKYRKLYYEDYSPPPDVEYYSPPPPDEDYYFSSPPPQNEDYSPPPPDEEYNFFSPPLQNEDYPPPPAPDEDYNSPPPQNEDHSPPPQNEEYYSPPPPYHYSPPPPPRDTNDNGSNIVPTNEEPNPPPKSQLSKGSLMGIIIGPLSFICLLVLVCAALVVRRMKMIRNPSPVLQPQQPDVGSNQQSTLKMNYIQPGMSSVQAEATVMIRSSCAIFTYQDLLNATNGFNRQNLLGRGAFGDVHRGILSDGTPVAIKQLNPESWQGKREFRTEVEVISRVHHNHLVKLVGYCSDQSRRLLVYELVPNGTLESHLHDGKQGIVMDWPMRMKVAFGCAKGLAYLHEDCSPKIIHRDIKAANILLDDNFEAKVADFGLAKEVVDDATLQSTRIVGSVGYLAPEYVSGSRLTDKSDVYSFGVVLLELITGKRPSTRIRASKNMSLVDWAKPLLCQALEDGNFEEFVDERLEKNYNQEEMARLVGCCAACIQYYTDDRPEISRVVRILEGLVSVEEVRQSLPLPSLIFSDSSPIFSYDSGSGPQQSNTRSRNMSGSNIVRSENYTSGSSE